jgi:diguanylate cyclase (GGDEF)-like protein
MNQQSGGPTGFGAASADESAAREQTRIFYRLSSILFLGGGLAAIPPDLLHRPAYPDTIFLLPLLAMVSGVVAWLIADRAPAWGLHLVAVVATLEIALTVAVADEVFRVYYVFVAIFVAYIFSDRRAIAVHLAFVIAAALAPIVYDSADARALAVQALIVIPTLVIAAGMVTYLRERLAASEDRYRHLSECDPLTGIGNYRMLVNRVPGELQRHRRNDRPMALIAIDLDDFKNVNDELGHQRGDLLLREVAEALADAVRMQDIVVRQGGDEFAVIAPETDLEEARNLAGRLRARLATMTAGEHRIGASIGVACYPADAESLEALLRVADERLRVAKGELVPRRPRRGAVADPG